MTLDNESLNHYLRLFSRLRTDRNARWGDKTRGQAPHKPILLLTVIDLFSQDCIPSNFIQITPELGELFASYWSIVMPPERRGNMALPFFHLRSSGFWHLMPVPGQEEVLKHLSQIDTLSKLRQVAIGAQLDEALFALLHYQHARNALRSAIISHYFDPQFHQMLMDRGQLNLDAFQYGQQLLDRAHRKAKDEIPEDNQYQAVRDQGFRRVIVRTYDHRCAFCGIRMLTLDGHSVVDAAHIIPWSVSHNDDLRNGMALCRLCHWTFDEGLASVSSEYAILLSDHLKMEANVPGHLLTVQGRNIIGPIEQKLWPSPYAIEWHRVNVFHME
jgi:putative restriction endonuclease